MGSHNAYRDGLSHARQQAFKAATEAIAQYNSQLAGRQRKIPRKLRRELAVLEQQLFQPINTLAEAQNCEKRTRDYLATIDAALVIVEAKQARGPQRLKQFGWLALLGLIPTGSFGLAHLAQFYDHTASCRLDRPPTSANYSALVDEDAPRCIYTSNEQCSLTEQCKRDGQCSLVGGACQATKTSDCRASSNCSYHGRCFPLFGNCVALKNKDCQASATCKQSGRCTRVGMECAATQDSDCAASLECQEKGNCGIRSGHFDTAGGHHTSACAPRSHADCTASNACLDNELCAMESGRCVMPRDSDCSVRTECHQDGRCQNYRAKCRVGSQTHCRQSTACTLYGRCTLKKGACKAELNDDCETAAVCHELGRCVARNDRCVKPARAFSPAMAWTAK